MSCLWNSNFLTRVSDEEEHTQEEEDAIFERRYFQRHLEQKEIENGITIIIKELMRFESNIESSSDH